MIDLERMLEIESYATKSPWYLRREITIDGLGEYDYFHSDSAREKYKGGPKQVMGLLNEQYHKDREYIVHSRNNFKAICLELKASREVVRIAKEMRSSHYGHLDELYKALDDLEAIE